MQVRNWMRAAAGAAILGASVSLAATPAKPSAAAGKAVYDRDCASCHGATGKGDGDDAAYFTTKPPDFTDKAVLGKRSDAWLAEVITAGGPSKGLSKDMPAAKLSPAEVQSVLAYIKTFAK